MYKEEAYSKTFEWDFSNCAHNIRITVSKSAYEFYKNIPMEKRERSDGIIYSALTTTRDLEVVRLARVLRGIAQNEQYDDFSEVSLILSFVQNIPYETDLKSTGFVEYPKFPIETLVDYCGDCEDHAILFGSLLLVLGYQVVYLQSPNHVAVGVRGTYINGSYWENENHRYFFCETVPGNFKIGQFSELDKKKSFKVKGVNENKQILYHEVF